MTQRHPSSQAPLAGIRVLDLGWLLPGPYCTGLLADLGAEVLKIERPGDGDYARTLLPGLFRLVNRGKRSAVFDLREADDRERLLALAASVDVFVEGFRPGVVDRLGVGHRAVSARNPAIVYASVSGFGQTGPDATQPAHDINVCAISGLLSIPASITDDGPRRMGLPVSDIAGSMHAALAILAALRRRDATGEGSYLDVSLADCALSWSALRWMDAPTGDSGWRHVNPANDLFRTSDDAHVALALVEPHFWARFCGLVEGIDADRASLAADRPPRHDQARADLLAIHRALAKMIACRDADFWVALGRTHDLPITRVADDFDAALATPHFRQRGSRRWRDGRPPFPIRLRGLPRSGKAPAFGADTARTLKPAPRTQGHDR